MGKYRCIDCGEDGDMIHEDVCRNCGALDSMEEVGDKEDI